MPIWSRLVDVVGIGAHDAVWKRRVKLIYIAPITFIVVLVVVAIESIAAALAEMEYQWIDIGWLDLIRKAWRHGAQ